MKLQTKALVVVIATLGVQLRVDTARADAVPPPPASCPKGQVGITDHGGPRCVPEAPKNCAPGYRGELGGRCVLATCSSDNHCEGGRRCFQIETCQEFRELHWTGWGWSAQRPASRDSFLAGPPRPQPSGPPEKAWVNLHICGQDGPCNAPAECRPTGLCYPPGSVGKTKAKVVDGTAPETPATSGSAGTGGTPTNETPPDAPAGTSGAEATPDPAAPRTKPDASSNDSGGCRRGCSMASTRSPVGWLGLAVLAFLGALRRGRRPARRSRRRPTPQT